MIKPILLLTALISSAAAFAQTPPSPVTAYVNAHLLPVSGAPLEQATILVTKGKITAVGAHVSIPAGAIRVDLHGATVIPGLVDASSSLFVTAETIAGNGTADQNVLDGIDPFDKSAEKALAAGVTTVYISPGSRGGVGGLGAIVKLQNGAQGTAATGAPVGEVVLKPKAGLELAIGLSTGGRSTSLERIGSYESMRTMFIGAQQYQKQQEKSELAKKAAAAKPNPPAPGAPNGVAPEEDSDPTGPVSILEPAADSGSPESPQGQRRQPGRNPGAGRPTQTATPRAQPAQEVLVSALKGDITVRIEAHRADDILNALRLADEFHLKLVLESPTEAATVLHELATHRVGIVWEPLQRSGPPQLDTIRYRPQTAGALDLNGVKLAVSPRGESGLSTRFVLAAAAVAASNGLSHEAALRAITLGAAEVLGVADRVGSIQVGRDADMVILSGSPWDPDTKVKQVIVNGAQAYVSH